jgi:hypothetical protein
MKYLKRFLSVLLTGLISLNAVSLAAFAEGTNDSSHFIYTVSDGVATIAAFDNLITDVTLPDNVVIDEVTYNSENEKLVIGKSLFRTTKSQTCSVENVVVPKGYKTLPQYIFRETASLKKVTCKYTGDDFKLNSYGFYKCTSLEKLYIYANSLNQSTILNVFNDVPTTAIAYVKNETVKTTMESLNWPGQIIVNPNLDDDSTSVNKTALQNKITEAETFLSGIDKSKYNNITELETAIAHAKTVNENASATQTEVDNEVIALASALNKVTKIKQASSFTITCESINYGTEGGFKPKVKITAGDGEITYKLFSDEACKNESGYNYNNSRISPNSYYIKGFMAETENYYASESNVLKVQVYSIGVSKKDLNDAITLAETFFEENESNKIDFNSAAWNDVYASNTGALARAKSIAQNNSGTIFQSEVDERTQKLITALNKLKESPADTTEIRAELDNVIKTAEAIENIYSNESWQAFQTALNAAKDAFAKENEFKSFYSNAKDTLFSAIENLTTEDAGEPFINIRKGGAESELINKKAEESMNGAVKVKLTLDCADDVSFNKYASIELKAIIAGTESYAKIVGTGTEEEAIKGKKGVVVELPLKNPIATGDDVKLTAYTWAWNGAKEHVYGITKVEFFDVDGHAMYAITDRTIAMDKLKAEIEKAEKIEQGNYSDESFAELTKAIESAKALEEKASKADIDKAIDALDKAVKGLKEPTPTEHVTPPTSQEPSSNSQPKKPSIAPTTKATRSNADVIKDRKTAQKIMKQAKITKLKAKSKAKKKITVSWKKVKKAKGYQVEVSAKKNFKKPIFKKFTAKTKLNIKNKKIKSKKTYYIRVRAYATYKDKNNVTKKVYSKWIKKIRKVNVK